MITFIISLIALVVGFVLYGTFVERVFGMVFVDFNVVWRYFAWTNQTLAVFTSWAGTIFFYKNSRTSNKYPYAYLIALIPALFMTMVSVSYIFIAPEGFQFAKFGLSWVAYLIAGITTIAMLCGFIAWGKTITKH